MRYNNPAMNPVITEQALTRENVRFQGTGGVSAENRSWGFHPAFLDAQTNIVYPSRFANGKRAPCLLLEGLPDKLVATQDAVGRVAAVKASVISGFACNGRFYTREEAARHIRREPSSAGLPY